MCLADSRNYSLPPGMVSYFSRFYGFITKYRNFRSVLDIVTLYLELVLFLFVALPFVFKYTPYIQRNMVFLPFVRLNKSRLNIVLLTRLCCLQMAGGC